MNIRFTALLAVLVCGLAFGACKTSDKGSGGGNGGEDACGDASKCGGEAKPDKEAEPKTDVADMMIKMYEDGQMQASPIIVMHEIVNVGQQWHVESDFGAGASVDKWQVIKKVGRSEVIVEQLTGQGYVLAYQVDTWADAGKPNVSKAWVGKHGGEPKEIKVMKLEPGSAGGEASEPGFMMKAKFYGVEMGGKTWAGETIAVSDEGYKSKTWVADSGWFSKVIRMDLNDKTVMKLVLAKFDEKVDTFLTWPKK